MYQRDRRGRWQEAGEFGIGGFEILVDHPMSAADANQVTFAGYSYGLTPVCRTTEAVSQTCVTGGKRTCGRCVQVDLQRYADHMGWANGKVRIGRVEAAPVDCSQPCPVDEWTPLLPRLETVLAGRRFAGVLAGGGPAVFRGASGCARELRRRHVAAAAERKAERAAAAAAERAERAERAAAASR